MANKTTKKEFFAMVMEIVRATEVKNKDELLAFLNHEVELLDKKFDKAKETKTKKANTIIMNTIKEVLGGLDKPVTITELMTDARLTSYLEETKSGSRVALMTNQKLTSLVKQLVDAGEVVRIEEKKKAYFTLAKTGEKEEGENVEETAVNENED